MRRRRSIGLLVCFFFGCLVATLTAEAEPATKIYRIGYLALGSSPTASVPYQSLEAFRVTLRDLGYAEGRNLVIEYRWGQQKSEALPALAAELVNLPVDLIFVPDTPSARAAKKATKTIPIVVMIFDPVGSGLVDSLSRPGGNVTGMSVMGIELWPKRLEMLREAVPGVSHVAGVYSSGPAPVANSLNNSFIRETELAAKTLGMKLTNVELGGDPTEWDQAFEAMARDGITALLLVQNPGFFANRAYLAELAVKHRLPTMYQAREYVEAGGLIAYGANIDEVSRRAAVFVNKILKGANPARSSSRLRSSWS